MDPATRAVRDASLPAVVARAAERLIAGAIVCVVDIRSDDGPGGGRGLDVVPDVVGMALVVWGLATLRRRPLTPTYDLLVKQCHLIACVGLAATVVDELSGRDPMPRGVGMVLAALALGGLYLFTLAMIEQSRAMGLPAEVLRSWQLCRRLVVGIYVPLFAVDVLVVVFARGGRLHIESAALTLVALFILAAPITYVIVSLVRTRRAAWAQLPPE